VRGITGGACAKIPDIPLYWDDADNITILALERQNVKLESVWGVFFQGVLT
jgi:hypothetical protein